VNQFSVETQSTVVYNIYTPPHTITYNEFDQIDDDCDYFVTYSMTMQSSANDPIDTDVFTYSAPTVGSPDDLIQLIVESVDTSKVDTF